jgi:hypothetical protein
MHALFVVLACFAGIFAFAFLLAGILNLQDFDRETNRTETIFQVIDALVLGSIGTAVRAILRNWSARDEARRLIYTGLVSLILFFLFVGLASWAV